MKAICTYKYENMQRLVHTIIVVNINSNIVRRRMLALVLTASSPRRLMTYNPPRA